MDHRTKLVIALHLALLGSGATAGFAQVTPPAAWTETAGVRYYRASSNDVSFSNGVRGGAGVLNVGGRSVSMPAAYRFAPNAARFAAGFAFGNPALFVGVAAASLAYQWYTSNSLSVQSGSWKQADPTVCTVAPCLAWRYTVYSFTGSVYIQPQLAACVAASDGNNATGGFYRSENPRITGVNKCTVDLVQRNNNAPFGPVDYSGFSQSVSPSPTSWIPVTQQQFEDRMAASPIPAGVPQVFPSPLPVDLPVLNPSPAVVPLAEPLRLPQGSPQPVPNTNPQTYRTPVVDIVPSPTLTSPWQVDVQPKDIVSTSPTPLPESSTTPTTEPAGQTSAPVAPDLCEKNPEILACKKVEAGELKPETVPSDTKNMSITKDSGWGPASASCPSPRTAVVQGITLSMPFDLLCDFASGVRPFVLGFAWLSAVMIFVGMGRKD